MVLSFDVAIAGIVIVPFLAAVFAPFFARETGRAAGWILAVIPAGLFLCLLSMLPAIASGQRISASLEWVPALSLTFSFLIDGLSLTFGLLISGIGAVIMIYSGAYLEGHRHLGRFFAFLLMFMGAMLGLVMSDSLVSLFAFWELTSVTSFLLIGFDHQREAARRAAIQALLVTGIGGLGLIVGGIVLQAVGGSWDLSTLMGSAGAIKASAAYPLILVAFLAAGFTKSAQVPFHFWLPNAMEAPTPVSAYLHSATMVQAGVYLLARLTPLLGGTPMWQGALTCFGAVTLLWGARLALRQSDLKQMLAHSTVASLGLLVMLLGMGGEAAITAVIAYFVAHALYKAALFLAAGVIEHETGTRDITALGGLRDTLTITFIGASLAALSMFGVPPFLGFLAKEEIYAALAGAGWYPLAPVIVLVAGNALLGAVALALMIKPFMGPPVLTPKQPRGEPAPLLLGPVLFGVLGLLAGFVVPWLGESILAPAATAISGLKIESHLSMAIDIASPAFWLSVLTWGLAGGIFWGLDWLRGTARRLERLWSFDRGFDALMFGLIRLAGAVTRFWHHGTLELYLLTVFALLAAALIIPSWVLGGWPALPSFPDLAFYEWAVLGLAAIGIVTVLMARTRLFAIIALGIQGLAVALLFMLSGAPDLAFTQLVVEVLSVVIFALVMTRLHLDARDARPFENLLGHGGLALVCGGGLTLLLLKVLEGIFDPRLSVFFERNSVAIAHGRNIVNVILVDFRGLDTLGEISVVMTAGIAILALIRGRHTTLPQQPTPTPAKLSPRRKAAT